MVEQECNEEWRDVVGWEGFYSVSALGLVRSDRSGSTLKPQKYSNGYQYVNLSRSGVKERRIVHRAVAESFIGPCPPGHQVNHINGIKYDNRAINLEWVTPTENIRHAMKHGLTKINGEQNANAKLTDCSVWHIRKQYAAGEATLQELADRFGVCRSVVGRVVRQATWRHVV